MKDREDFKTYNEVFDSFTVRNIFELSSKGYFEDIVSKIKVGKESNIFLASREGELVIIKIYLLSTSNFNNMLNYLREDKRYTILPKRKRQIIFTWAKREYRNLIKMKQARMNSPMPIHFKDNILIMKMIGEKEPANQLKDYWPLDPDDFFEKLIEEIKKMFKDAQLVHGDLSGFNILNHDETPYIIDVAQAISSDSPNAFELLRRDLGNIATVFRKVTKKDLNVDSCFYYIIGDRKNFSLYLPAED